MIAPFQISAAWLLAPLLVAVILYDLRFMRIPNVLVKLVLIVAVVSLIPALEVPELIWRTVAAAVVFAVTLTLFALRLMGGGDVKLLAVLTLFIPTGALAHFALIFSVGIFAGVAILKALRVGLRHRETNWRSLQDHTRFPLGLSIGMSGLAFIVLGPLLT